MGLLADIFLATAGAEVVSYNTAPDTSRIAFGTKASQIWRFLLSGIASLASKWDRKRMGDLIVIPRLPSAMLKDLALLTPHQVAAALVKRVMEELRCDPGEVRPIIDELVTTARKALQSAKNVYYLWDYV